MVESILLLTCFLLTPWLVQFARHARKRPEAIPTPTWMVVTMMLFVFLFPLVTAFIQKQPFGDHGPAAIRIMLTTVLYWVTFTATYLLAAGRARTVSPDGPRGIPTCFGVLKQVAESSAVMPLTILFVILTLIKVFFLQSTGLGISGGGLVMLTLPYHLVVLRLLTQSASDAFTAIFAFHLFGKASAAGRLLAALGIAAELIFAVMAGRRPVLFTLGLVALGALWSGKRRQALALVGLGISIWFLVFVFSPIFLRAREIWRSPNGPGVIVAFQKAMEYSVENEDAVAAESAENITQRMNSYAFWIDFYERVGSQDLGGTLLIQAVVMTVPRAIAGWWKYAYGATEEAVFGTNDIANNVCLESSIDLGPLGPLAYGAVFGLLFSVIDRLVYWMSRRNKYVALMAVGSVFSLLLSPEADLMSYFGSLRQCLIFAVLTFVAVYLFGLKPANRTQILPPGGFRRKSTGFAV